MLADDAREGDDNTFQLGLIMNSTILAGAGAGFSTRRARPAALSSRLAQNGRQPEPVTGIIYCAALAADLWLQGL